MVIQGTVIDVKPPHFTDDYGNAHQWVTVTTAAGPVVGVKASKKELSANFVNQQVQWDMVTMKDGQGQPYNKFKRPPQNFQQQAQQVQTAINQGRQAPQQAAQRPNAPDWDAIAEGKVRHGIVCAYLAAGAEPEIAMCEYWKAYIMTGKAPPPPGQVPNEPIQQPAWEH
jgi:hypothetical protein